MEIRLHQHKHKWGLSSKNIEIIVHKVSEKIDLLAASIDIIFTDDDTISTLHQTYLDDPSPTDIITFDLGSDEIEGEIYISVDRAQEQAKRYHVTLAEELTRLIVHGLLHLKGYDDKEKKERKKMKQKEDDLVRLLCREI